MGSREGSTTRLGATWGLDRGRQKTVTRYTGLKARSRAARAPRVKSFWWQPAISVIITRYLMRRAPLVSPIPDYYEEGAGYAD